MVFQSDMGRGSINLAGDLNCLGEDCSGKLKSNWLLLLAVLLCESVAPFGDVKFSSKIPSMLGVNPVLI